MSFLLISLAVFLGAFVSGLSGFAFSAVAGAILLHMLEPTEAVPLMMACSVGVQATNLWALRKFIRWKETMALVFGGILGVPIAVWLLHNMDAHTFRRGFGLFVAAYATYGLCRPALTRLPKISYRQNALIGFGGGLVGGLTAMPGAIPTIWCDIKGVPKNQQRGLVQPFIAAMQIFALILLVMKSEVSSRVLFDLAACVPALFAGSVLGILAFSRVDESAFRRIILSVLLVSGALLVF